MIFKRTLFSLFFIFTILQHTSHKLSSVLIKKLNKSVTETRVLKVNRGLTDSDKEEENKNPLPTKEEPNEPNHNHPKHKSMEDYVDDLKGYKDKKKTFARKKKICDKKTKYIFVKKDPRYDFDFAEPVENHNTDQLCKGMIETCCSHAEINSMIYRINKEVALRLIDNLDTINVFKKMMLGMNQAIFYNILKQRNQQVVQCTKGSSEEYVKFFGELVDDIGTVMFKDFKEYYATVITNAYGDICRFCDPKEGKNFSYDNLFMKYSIDYNLLNAFKRYYQQIFFSEKVFKVNLLTVSLNCIFNYEGKQINLSSAKALEAKAREIVNSNNTVLIDNYLPKGYISFSEFSPFDFEYVNFSNLNALLNNISGNKLNDEFELTKKVKLLDVYEKSNHPDLESGYITSRFIQLNGFFGNEDIKFNQDTNTPYSKELLALKSSSIARTVILLVLLLTK